MRAGQRAGRAPSEVALAWLPIHGSRAAQRSLGRIWPMPQLMHVPKPIHGDYRKRGDKID
jgi:hypothetical protein